MCFFWNAEVKRQASDTIKFSPGAQYLQLGTDNYFAGTQ
jgi:hypothetical protein